MVLVAVGISLLNLIIIIVGILWINDAFQQAEENEEGVAETLRARIEILYSASALVGIPSGPVALAGMSRAFS